MDHEYDLDETEESKIVYVRKVSVNELPEDMRDQAGDVEMIYAVHNSEGERLALVVERELAFELAREHDYSPVTVH